eukprot:scaffold2116_cov140-Chaetoceros_neogracile.AAC.3
MGLNRRHHRVHVVAVVLVLMVRMHSGIAFGISKETAHCLTKTSFNHANQRRSKDNDIMVCTESSSSSSLSLSSLSMTMENQDDSNSKSNSRQKISPWSEERRRYYDRSDSEDQQDRHYYLCVITETNACDSMENVEQTIRTLERALGTFNTHAIDLISIRVKPPLLSDGVISDQFQERIIHLATQIMTMKAKHQSHPLYNDYKVVINDALNLQAAMEAKIDGIHVKEKDAKQIPYIRSTLYQHLGKEIIVGTSAHSITSAVTNYQLYKPDYMFVGTCFLTQSHPEKNSCDLEGPTLPGLVKKAIRKETDGAHPIIFAIGGIESENCHHPVGYGSDGVAVIRSVMQASDPALAVKFMKEGMKTSIRSSIKNIQQD